MYNVKGTDLCVDGNVNNVEMNEIDCAHAKVKKIILIIYSAELLKRSSLYNKNVTPMIRISAIVFIQYISR